jgi:hypothetical protein
VDGELLLNPPESEEKRIVQTMTRVSVLTGVTGVLLVAFAMAACGPPRIAVGIGGPPVCPYGYYEAPPYNCAPDGYYGPEWFAGGVFIGVGPWYHGPRFYGHVDHALDYRQSYRGPFPARGEAPVQNRAPFRGMATHDTRGREAPAGRR